MCCWICFCSAFIFRLCIKIKHTSAMEATTRRSHPGTVGNQPRHSGMWMLCSTFALTC